MIVAGLDLSLTSTGVAKARSDGEALVGRLRAGKRRGHDRLEWLAQEVCAWAGDAGLVVVEGPSYGSQGNALHQLGGLWWVICHRLWLASIPYAVVSPSLVKKYATGRGNADKDAVLASVIRRFPAVPVEGNDEADALVLAAMGADRLGWPLAEMPKEHRRVLGVVDWPALGEATLLL